MIIHVVMFKFKRNTSKESILESKARIEALIKSISTLESIEVGINFSTEERAMDMSLVSKFKSREELDKYAIHPEHLKVIEFIKTIAEYSKVVDYETQD